MLLGFRPIAFPAFLINLSPLFPALSSAAHIPPLNISYSEPRDAPSISLSESLAELRSPGKKLELASSYSSGDIIPQSLKALTTSSLQKKPRPSSVSLTCLVTSVFEGYLVCPLDSSNALCLVSSKATVFLFCNCVSLN